MKGLNSVFCGVLYHFDTPRFKYLLHLSCNNYILCTTSVKWKLLSDIFYVTYCCTHYQRYGDPLFLKHVDNLLLYIVGDRKMHAKDTLDASFKARWLRLTRMQAIHPHWFGYKGFLKTLSQVDKFENAITAL